MTIESDTYRRNPDGTVTLITPAGGEHTYDPDDLDNREDDPVRDIRDDDPEQMDDVYTLWQNARAS